MSTKIMELGGALPIYIPYNISSEELYPILEQVNGIFFTGGSIDLSDLFTDALHPYTITAKKIYDYALKSNDNGVYFPIIGICQGMELLHILVANDTKALGWSTLLN
jgi:gamma-glutamyl hydrolase